MKQIEYIGHCPYCGTQLGFGHIPELCDSRPASLKSVEEQTKEIAETYKFLPSELSNRVVLAEQQLARERHEFENFHEQLCLRFDYCHDPVDWKRDQVSLIEHIAQQRDRAEQMLLTIWNTDLGVPIGELEILLRERGLIR